MSDIVDKRVLSDALKTLAGYLDDLGRVDFDHAVTKLRLVINYAQRDETARSLAGLFRSRFSREEFLEHVMGDHGLTPPESALDRLAFAYDLLLHVKMGWKLNLREILSRAEFSGGGLEDRWARFQKRFVAPLQAGVLAIRAEVDRTGSDRLDPEVVIPQAAAALYPGAGAPSVAAAAPRAVVTPATPSGPGPSVEATPPAEVPAQLRPLAEKLEAADLDPNTRGDLTVDLELLGIELAKVTPASARLVELVEGFAGSGLGAVAQACLGEHLVSDGDNGGAATVRAALADERAAIGAERAALKAERDSLTAEREALAGERKALDAQRSALAAERDALTASQRAARPSN